MMYVTAYAYGHSSDETVKEVYDFPYPAPEPMVTVADAGAFGEDIAVINFRTAEIADFVFVFIRMIPVKFFFLMTLNIFIAYGAINTL